MARRGWTVRRLLGALALGLATTAACSASSAVDDAAPAPAPALPAEREIAEVNFGDLTVAESPVVRTLASPDTSSWRRAADRGDLEREARSFLERPDEPDVDVLGGPTTWVHPSGQVAVQYDVADPNGGSQVATVLFITPET